MKLFFIIIVLLAVQNACCRQIARPKRSYVFEYISNKTSQVKNYISKKGESIKNTTKNYARNAISSVSHFFISDKKSSPKEDSDKVNIELQYYIEKVQGTTNEILNTIAPEEVDPECSDNDPANDMTAPQLITLHGYYVESHTILTDDGYILTVHRIPHSRSSNKTRRTVLLHHGFLGCSIDWVIPGPRKSLPYILSEAGFDVWMANARGNTYSRQHIFRNVESAAFWNFTFQDIAEYDLPAVIDYIEEHKTDDEKIDYIGYSMGTTILFALLSTKTQYNDVLRAGYTLAPVAYMTGIKSPFRILAKYGNTIETIFKITGANQFLPRNTAVRILSKHSCKIEDFQGAICDMSMLLLCGHDKHHFDRSLMPMILGHVPAGASTKTLVHFGQEIRNDGKFQKFDYGSEGNLREYGTATPPEYPLHKISLPISMISAQDDWLSSISDAIKIYQQIGRPVEHYVVPDEEYNHLDFLFAKDAKTMVYDKLMLMIERPLKKSMFETNHIV